MRGTQWSVRATLNVAVQSGIIHADLSKNLSFQDFSLKRRQVMPRESGAARVLFPNLFADSI